MTCSTCAGPMTKKSLFTTEYWECEWCRRYDNYAIDLGFLGFPDGNLTAEEIEIVKKEDEQDGT